MPASECTLSYSTKNKTKHPKVHVQETRFVSTEKASVRTMKINDAWKRLCHVGLRTWKQTRIPKNPSRRTDHLQETSNDSPQATCSKTNYLENVDKQCLKANACCPTPETRSNKRPLSLPQGTRQALQAKQRAGTSQHFLKPLRKC